MIVKIYSLNEDTANVFDGSTELLDVVKQVGKQWGYVFSKAPHANVDLFAEKTGENYYIHLRGMVTRTGNVVLTAAKWSREGNSSQLEWVIEEMIHKEVNTMVFFDRVDEYINGANKLS